MRISFLNYFIGISCPFFLVNANQLNWTECGSNDQRVFVDQFDISPQPIPVQPFGSLNISIKARTTTILNDLVNFKLRIIRKIHGVFGKTIRIQIPCIANMGSCSYKFCELFKLINATICPFLKQHGYECDCPLTAISIEAENLNIPSILKRAGSGIYEIGVQIINDIGKSFGCLRLEMSFDLQPTKV
ncbi:ganglioside GM2 activator-like isoform X2 [Dinothrombium tinctorium]|uniref:Ganglioside GM2 activator-like isoform X2 n=1 Tax=Dinothrombium tinctorium TaxID=1965070 RepID=A0A3S4QM96_9ACAR|nr:ganglioside GM2 activator-like isoform X2 [Dinothrombium tinctorium]